MAAFSHAAIRLDKMLSIYSESVPVYQLPFLK
jgi:hypothetical protein